MGLNLFRIGFQLLTLTLAAAGAVAAEPVEMEKWTPAGPPRSIEHALSVIRGPAQERAAFAGNDLSSGELAAGTFIRVRALLIPPADGDYRFAIAGDDMVSLDLSADGLPFKKREIARLDTYTGPHSWRDHPGQLSAAIRLTKGQACYLEARCLNPAGAGHFEVGWIPPGTADIVRLPLTDGPGNPVLTRYIPPAGDTDDDGLPDDWERENGLAVEKDHPHDGSAGDSDGDLAGNRQEYLDGTDPRTADSRPGKVLTEVWPGRGDLVRPQLFRFGDHLLPRPAVTERLESAVRIAPFAVPGFQRTRGFILPPATGRYRFHLAGPGMASLDLASTGDAMRKVRVILGGNILGEHPPGLVPSSEPVELKQGERCYFELVLFRTRAGPLLEFAWTRPDGQREEIPMAALHSYFPPFPDADRDGLPDAWEKEHKLDVDGANPKHFATGDADFDGADNQAEYLAKSDPLKGDSDGDNISDGSEIHHFGSDPLTPQRTLADEMTVVDYKSIHGTGPGWSLAGPPGYESHNGMEQPLPDRSKWCFSHYRGCGELEWPFVVKQAGFHALSIQVHPVSSFIHHEIGNRTRFHVDGKRLPDIVTYGRVMSVHRVVQITPWLEPGEHTMRVGVEGAYLPTVTRIFGYGSRPVLPGAATEALRGNLAKLNRFTGGTGESRTSPISVEFTGRGEETRTLVAGKKSIAMKSIAATGSWAEADLPEDGSALPLEVAAEGGGLISKATASWIPTNVLEGGQLTLRAGDSLRLTAAPPVPGATGRTKVEHDGESQDLKPGGTWTRKFTRSGVHQVKGRFDPGSGAPVQEGVLQVTVLTLPEPLAPVLARAGSTTPLPALPAGLEFDGGPVAFVMPATVGKPALLSPQSAGNFQLPLRLAGGGAIAGTLELQAFQLRLSDEPYFAGKDSKETIGKMVHVIVGNAPPDSTLLLECKNPDAFVPFIEKGGNEIRVPVRTLPSSGLATLHLRALKSVYDRLNAEVSLILPDGTRR